MDDLDRSIARIGFISDCAGCCHNTETNRAFLAALSEELITLKESGVYRQVAGSLYVNFDTRQWLVSSDLQYPLQR